MDEPMVDPRLGTDTSGGAEFYISPDARQKLFSGLETGFNNVMGQLSLIKDQIGALPAQTAEAVSGRIQGLGFGSESNKGQIAAAGVANDLAAKNQDLENRRLYLEERLERANKEIVSKAGKETELRNDILELKRQVARLEKKEVEFRDIILRDASTQKITDQDVIHSFSDLRQSVQQLAKSQVFDLSYIPPLPPLDSKKQQMRHFYNIVRDLPVKDVNDHLRAQIFNILDQRILNRKIFGLKRENFEGKLNKEYWDIENDLERLEEILLDTPMVNENMVADWRISTMECISMLKLDEEYSIYVAGIMEGFFAPLNTKRSSIAQKNELWEKMKEVCRKAVNLKMMMQRSKEGYIVDILDPKENPHYSKLEHKADSMGVKNGKTADASDDIAYVLFGALTKYSKQMGGERKTLVKAEVILKRKSKG